MNTVKKYWWAILLIFVGVFILAPWAIIFVINHIAKNNNEFENPYYYSCIIGSLFSGLAFVGVLWTLMSQKEQTKIQEKTYELQNKSSQRQSFETTLFNMLSLQQQIVNDLSFSDMIDSYAPDGTGTGCLYNKKEEITIKGRGLFRYFFCEIKLENKAHPGFNYYGIQDLICALGLCKYRDSIYTTYFDHYFRHLYTMIKFIDKSDLKYDDKYKYTSIVRATLSRYELVCLYYNCLCGYGNGEFKRMVERYSLLKNMRVDLLALSAESCNILSKENLNIEALKESDFSKTDYEFYITNEKDDDKSYYIGAFYNQNESDNKKEGDDLLKRWNEFIKSNN